MNNCFYKLSMILRTLSTTCEQCIDYIDYTSKQTYDISMETVENNLQAFITERSNKFP